jgi:hypothetical protein
MTDALALEVISIEPLGRATVLHLALGKARLSLCIEPPLDATPLGKAAVAVPDAKHGAAWVKALAVWLGVDVPRRVKGALAKPPPVHLGAIALQEGVDGAGVAWQRTKLAVGAGEELYLVWSRAGGTAWLSEKDSEQRGSLMEALAIALRDGVAGPPMVEGGLDPLRRDVVPLVTSLELSTRRPSRSVGCFWREGRFVFPEYDGRQTSVTALGLDGRAEVLATIDAPVRFLALAGPHLVATAGSSPALGRGPVVELWLVRSGEKKGALWLPHDENFLVGPHVTPVTSDDGTLFAVTGRGRRGAGGFFDWVKVLDDRGRLVVELEKSGHNVHADRWADGALVLLVDDKREWTWRPQGRRVPQVAKPSPRYSVHFDGRDGLEVRDATTGAVRPLGGLRAKERASLAKHGERGVRSQPIEPHHALIHSGDHLLLDCQSLASWVVLPHLPCVVSVSPTLDAVAVMPHDGRLFLGRINPRWKETARNSRSRSRAQLEKARGVVVDALVGTLDADRYQFDGVSTQVVPTHWASRFGLTPEEVVRRLDVAGRARVDGVYSDIDAAMTLPDVVMRLASLSLAGAPGLVFAMRHAHPRWTKPVRSMLAVRLKRLAAEGFATSLDSDRKVREALGV